MTDDNLRQDHRHSEAWQSSPLHVQSRGWLAGSIIGCLAIWTTIILLIRSCT